LLAALKNKNGHREGARGRIKAKWSMKQKTTGNSLLRPWPFQSDISAKCGQQTHCDKVKPALEPTRFLL